MFKPAVQLQISESLIPFLQQTHIPEEAYFTCVWNIFDVVEMKLKYSRTLFSQQLTGFSSSEIRTRTTETT
jgi:hypothetical protein